MKVEVKKGDERLDNSNFLLKINFFLQIFDKWWENIFPRVSSLPQGPPLDHAAGTGLGLTSRFLGEIYEEKFIYRQYNMCEILSFE